MKDKKEIEQNFNFDDINFSELHTQSKFDLRLKSMFDLQTEKIIKVLMTLKNAHNKVVPKMYYDNYPTDYVNELRMNGHRFKSGAFIDYLIDYRANKKNSLRFYGKAWNKAPSTCKIWIDEFKKVIELEERTSG